MSKFIDWLTDEFRGWLRDIMLGVAIQVACVTVLELFNISIFDWFVYPSMNWEGVKSIIDTIWLIDFLTTALYFLVYFITWFMYQLRNSNFSI